MIVLPFSSGLCGDPVLHFPLSAQEDGNLEGSPVIHKGMGTEELV